MIKTKSNSCQIFTCSSPKHIVQVLLWDQVKLLNENTRTWHANANLKMPQNRLKLTSSPFRISQTVQWFNQSIAHYCRATWVLQLWLKEFGKIWNGLQTKIPQRGLQENWKLKASAPTISQFLEFQNSTKLILESPI